MIIVKKETNVWVAEQLVVLYSSIQNTQIMSPNTHNDCVTFE